jgi:flagellin
MGAALTTVADEISKVGAFQSRLGFAVRQLQTMAVGQAEASSRIIDADIAEETARLVSGQVLQQSASAVLAQANLTPEIALRLLAES